MTPEEYFGSQAHFNKNLQEMVEADKQHVIQMISEYADQQSIGFVEWIAEHPLQLQPGRKNGEWIGLDFAYYTTTELLTLYKQSI